MSTQVDITVENNTATEIKLDVTQGLDVVLFFKFPKGSVIAQELTVSDRQQTTYNNVIVSSGVTSYTIEVNGTPVSVPFSLSSGDTLKVSVTKSDFSTNEQLELQK